MNEELKVIISAEISKLKSGVEGAKKQISTFKKNVGKYSKEIEESFKKVSDGINNGLKVAGAAVASAGAALLALTGSTAEYRNEQAKLKTAFETAGGSAKTAKKTYNDLYRVLGDSGVAVEAAGHLAKMTTNQKELSEWTTICQGVYATFGDSIPIEGLTEAANETAKVGTVTGTLADALNWAGISEDAFNESLAACNTEAEREKLIRETLNGLYGDAAANYEKNNAAILAQNEAQGRLNEKLAAVGEALQPVNTALTNLAADVLAQLTPYITEFAENHLPAIIEALSGVGEKVGEVISWIADNWELIVNLGTVVLTVAAAFEVFSTVMAVVNAVMSASPITWIVAAIVALIAVIALCVIYWDEIKAAIIAFAQAAGEWLANLWAQISDWIAGIVEKFSQWWSNTKQGFAEWWSGIKQGWVDFWAKVGKAISDGVAAAVKWFSEMKEKIGEFVGKIVSSVSEKFAAVKETISTATSEAKKTAVDSISNMRKAYDEHGGGIKGAAAAAMEGVKGYYKTGFTFIDSLTGGKLSSIVSKVSEKMGQVKQKIASILDNVKQKFTDIFENAKTIVSNAIEKVKGMFNFSWKLPKPGLPHFKVSGGKAPWGFMGEGSLPSVKVEWYAKGGVFDTPTIFPYGNGKIGGLGEQGAEAIVPLEKNTEWLDKIAEKLASKQGLTPIVLTVDGKVFAQTTIDSINQLTRQTGALGLNLV